ncbi:MAG: aldehyde dehydrogenase family protein [Methanomassiliicoccales archaeon]
MEKFGLFINGKWVEPSSADRFETRNPSDGKPLASFPSANAKDVSRAVDAAADAFEKWRQIPAPMRGELLLEAALNIQRRKEELAKLVSTEMGKVIAEARGEVQEAIDFFKYIAGEGRRLFGETTPSELPQKFNMTVRLPKGPVALITPWNFPISIPSWKMGAALISGCTLVLKPASDTPLCAAKFIEVVNEAGFPPGVINMVTGQGAVAGTALIEHEKIRAVSFTGGVSTGREVYSSGARRLIQVHLELGGKNPLIVMDDANVELAVEGTLFGAFGTAGQRCTATSRLLVHRDVYEQVLDKLVERVERFRIGNPLEEETDMGPVINRKARDSILNYIESGKEEGGKIITGGHALERGEFSAGNYVEPTIIETKHGTRISREEIFGPVLSVIRCGDLKEAFRIANDVPYGLSSSIYTRNLKTALQAITELQSGITYVNAPTIGAEIHLPFGGVKNTGTGGREAGSVAIEEFTELKSVFIDYSDRLQKAQIDTLSRFKEVAD